MSKRICLNKSGRATQNPSVFCPLPAGILLLTPLMSSGGPTCWYSTRLADVTPRPAAAALIVVHTMALAATWELPVMNSVLPSEIKMGLKERSNIVSGVSHA